MASSLACCFQSYLSGIGDQQVMSAMAVGMDRGTAWAKHTIPHPEPGALRGRFMSLLTVIKMRNWSYIAESLFQPG